MISPQQVITDSTIPADTTCLLSLQLTDENDAPLQQSALSSLELTLYEQATRTIINGRNAQSVFNVNGGTLAAGGLLTLVLSVLDNALVFPQQPAESHVALIRWTWLNGAKAGWKEITFTVVRGLL